MKASTKLFLCVILTMLMWAVPTLAETDLSQFEYKNDGTIFTSIDLKETTKASVDFDSGVSLLSTSDSISDATYNFQMNGNTLSGTFSADITVSSDISANVILAVYDGNKLDYIQRKACSLKAGSTSVSFENIEAGLTNDNFAVKLFAWESKNCKPICKEYVFAVDYTPSVYIDGFEAEDVMPVYIYGEEIYAPISILQDLGVMVQLDTETGIIYTMKNNSYMNMQIGNKYVYAQKGSSSSEYTTVIAPSVMNGTIYIPMTTACKAYKFDIKYNLALGEFKFYTNEIMEAEYRKVEHNDYTGRLVVMNNAYSVVINNGLFYYVAMDRPCIYITNGSATVSYSVSGIPSGLIVVGDNIYYAVAGMIYEMDKHTGKSMSIGSIGFTSTISYYNGKIYTGAYVYHLATGERVTYLNLPTSDVINLYGGCKYVIINDEHIIWVGPWFVNSNTGPSSIYVDVTKINTNTGEAEVLDKYYIYYNKYNSYHKLGDIAFHNGQIMMYLDSPVGNDMYLCTDGDFTNIDETTEYAYTRGKLIGRSDIDRFAATLIPSDYSFMTVSSGITRFNRKNASQIIVISGKDKEFVTANDEYIVYNDAIITSYYDYKATYLQVADISGNLLGTLGVYSDGTYTTV